MISPSCWFTPQMVAVMTAAQGGKQEPRASFSSYTWMPLAPVLGPFLLSIAHIRRQLDRYETSSPMWDAGIAGGCSALLSTISAPRNVLLCSYMLTFSEHLRCVGADRLWHKTYLISFNHNNPVISVLKHSKKRN